MAAIAGNGASVEEAVAFIATYPHVYLLGRRADGYPTGFAMMSRAHDGVVEFSTTGPAPRSRISSARAPQASLLSPRTRPGCVGVRHGKPPRRLHVGYG